MLIDGEDAYQRPKDMLSKQYVDPFAVGSARDWNPGLKCHHKTHWH